MMNRGFTLIEFLVALLLMAVAIMGMVTLFGFGFSVTGHSQDIGAGYNIARREVEKARNISFLLLPEGTETILYDGFGNITTAPSPHYTVTKTVQTIPDANGQLNTGCLRQLTVTVVANDRSEATFQTVTYFTRGGI